jgi:glucokinase
MLLGIEIGGTKLQFGVGHGDGRTLAKLERLDVQPQLGAERIRRQIHETCKPLIDRYQVTGIGIGFGGPVDSDRGRAITSHQVEGWKDFPLADWCRETLGVPALLANDSDSAGLAEALFGAGKGHSVVVYNNIGSGIGGAIVIRGRLYSGSQGVAAEFGHLRPGPEAERPDQDLEAVASGWGITAAVRGRVAEFMPSAAARSTFVVPPSGGSSADFRLKAGLRTCALPSGGQYDSVDAQDLLDRCGGNLDRLNTRIIAEAARAGNRLAAVEFDRACRTIGWALAQVITVLAPSVVVMGGGVSLVGEDLFFGPLRRYVAQYVFPALAGKYQIVPAALGEEVVVYGALALAAEQFAA